MPQKKRATRKPNGKTIQHYQTTINAFQTKLNSSFKKEIHEISKHAQQMKSNLAKIREKYLDEKKKKWISDSFVESKTDKVK